MPAPFDRPTTHHLPALRHLTVAGVARVTPVFARVTLTGADLDGFPATGPDDHVKVFFPDSATGEITVPTPRLPGTDPDAGAPRAPVLARDYTPRAFRPATEARPATTDHPATEARPAELDLDILLHGTGVASTWAASARPGDRLVVGGPRVSKALLADATAVLLLGDESALPAIARWLEQLPAGTPISVLLEVADARARSYFPDELRMRADILWLLREHGAGQLLAALRGLGPLDEHAFVFGAGEAAALVPLRQHLRKDLGLPATRVALNGYWKATA
ncbi:siderophore-interacting protein [Herbiconiux sp. VKM Ac-2851]|uniref:siderophore-interacting protein n=1 Tax=Herbiconiux sp. VKM Ac-2851 TaxID=2739025 RepID=UPI0015647F14|nr:siderophore-interacting protein [Herbiconiux sp. VKM Ac-2851]NQX34759.1 siderophore-interacting protein [Herbiconiux sp. VKM Ac-2851]